MFEGYKMEKVKSHPTTKTGDETVRRLAASDVIIGNDDDTEADSDRDEKRRAAALQSAAEGAAEMHIDWLSDTTLHVFSERARVGEEK